MLHVVIMAGGSGTRFWPRSRRVRPKQLIGIAGHPSMLAAAYGRAAGVAQPENIWVVTTSDLAEAVRAELPKLPKENLIAEPVGRDTAAAIGLAAVAIQARNPRAAMAVVPSDHAIEPAAKFHRAVKAAAQIADESEYLLTFAIRPSHPATGYGYIEKGNEYDGTADTTAFHVQEFTEKPDLATAKRYLRQGKYFWNSGIFVWRASAILAEIQKYLPAHAAALEEIAKTWGTAKAASAIAKTYDGMRKVSIDYGVMEPAAHAGHVLMVPADFQWDDVGSWTSLANHLPPDPDGNVIEGRMFVGVDSQNNIVSVEDEHLVTALGVSNLVIIHTPDATMVASREKAQEIKKLIAKLEEKKLEQYL